MLLSRWRYYLGSVPLLLAGSRRPIGTGARLLAPGRRAPVLWELREGPAFAVRSALDVWVVKETWLDRFYDRHGVPVEDGWSVLDVGAGLGDYTLLAATRSPRGRVVAFEPDPASFALLEANVARAGAGNVTLHRAALGAPGQTLRLEEGARAPVRARTVEAPAAGPGPSVPTLSLEEALDGAGLAACDLVKLDCEGAEVGILLAASTATLRRVRHFVLETHDLGAGPGPRELAERLAADGFEVRRTPNPAWSFLGWLHARRLD